MPNLVVYVPAAIWRRVERLEGKSAKVVARMVAREAIIEYVTNRSAPDGAPSPPGSSGVQALTAGPDSGADDLPED